MNLWFTSDHHFNHKNIIKYSSRPFSSLEEMNEKLIENWNKNIKGGDAVYHLGDFFFTHPKFITKIFERLNGKITLIKGNHDHIWLRKVDLKIVTIDYLEIKVDKKLLVLMHFPIESWNKRHFGAIHLHGHTHGNSRKVQGRLDVGVDNAFKTLGDYRPFSYDEIQKYSI